MRTDVPQVHGELRTFLATEYHGDGAAVTAAIRRHPRARRARLYVKRDRRFIGTVLRTARAVAAIFAAPGGA